MTETQVLDAMNATGRHWLRELMQKLELPPDEAERGLRALRAGLHAIRDRLPAGEVVDLAAQLPVLVRGLYYEGWRLANDPARIGTPEELVARVERELRPDTRLSAVTVLDAVIALLSEHVSPGELIDVVSTLPRPIAKLWVHSAEH